AELPAIRRTASTLEATIQSYGGIDHQLVAVGASIAAVMPDAEYGRMAKSYLALLEARESAALAGLRRAEPDTADPMSWLRAMSRTLPRLRPAQGGPPAPRARRARAGGAGLLPPPPLRAHPWRTNTIGGGPSCRRCPPPSVRPSSSSPGRRGRC